MVADKSNGFSSSSQMASSFVSRSSSSRRSLPPKTSGRASQGRTASYYESSSTIDGGATHYNGGTEAGGGAPTFGQIRITQSTERDAGIGNGVDGVDFSLNQHHHRQRSPYVSRRSSVSSVSAYAASPTPGTTASRRGIVDNRSTSPSHRRRYSFTTDRIFSKDRTLELDDEDLNYETTEFLNKSATVQRPRSSLSYTHKVVDRNHHFSSPGQISPSDHHRMPSYSAHGSQNEEDFDLHVGNDLHLGQISKKVPGVHPRSSLNYMHKVGERNHFTTSGDISPDPYGNKPSYLSPYRRIPGMHHSPSHNDFETSAQYRSLSQSRQARANSMPRIQTLETLRQESGNIHEVRGVYCHPNARARSVSRIGAGRGISVEPHEQTVDFAGSDADSFALRRQRRIGQNRASRAASMSRVGDHIGGHQVIYAPRYSVASIASNSSSSYHPFTHVNHPGTSSYISGGSSRIAETTLYGGVNGGVADENDITKYVFTPGEKFLPTDVSVSVLPSGKKAVTYTRFSQKGSGDQREANAEIDRIVAKTKLLQDSMHTLEDFVKRNRSLFPEDIIIYQRIVFYLLSEEELKRIGYSADAEVYGVKIREKLVAPHGTDVASILKRYYSKHKEVDVEYEERETIRRRLAAVEAEGANDDEASRRRTTRHTRIDTEWEEEEELRRRRHAANQQRGRYIDEEEEVITRRPESRRRREISPEPPQFTARLRAKRIDAGETVKLSCSAIGTPTPVITWYLNGRQIGNGLRHNIDNSQPGSSSLCIRNTNHEDGGTYTARAVNAHGEVSCTATVTVEEDELARRKDALRRPWFIREPHNTTTQVGQRIVLEAQATGRPLPTFKWQKNNIEITEDMEHVRIVTDGEGITRLILRDVRLSDAGQYVCIAENEAGRIASTAALRVGEAFDLTEYYTLDEFQTAGQRQPMTPSSRGKDHPLSAPSTLPFEIDELIIKHWNHPMDFSLFSTAPGEERPVERGRKPHFVQVPAIEITVNEGDPVTLRCIVEGEPKPLVKWYKNVRELTYSGRHRVLAERNDHYMMQIRSTMLTDAGEYTIVAVNACGMIKYNLFINVIPRKQEEQDEFSLPGFTPKELDLIPRKEQGKMAPVFIKRLPREKELIVGGTLELECHIEEAKMKEYIVGYDIVVKGVPVSNDQSATSSRNVKPSSNNEVKDPLSEKPLLKTFSGEEVKVIQGPAGDQANESDSSTTPSIVKVEWAEEDKVSTDPTFVKVEWAEEDKASADPTYVKVEWAEEDKKPTDTEISVSQEELKEKAAEDLETQLPSVDKVKADQSEASELNKETTKRSKSGKKRDKRLQQEANEASEPSADNELISDPIVDELPAEISHPIVESTAENILEKTAINISEETPVPTSETTAVPIQDLNIVQPVSDSSEEHVSVEEVEEVSPVIVEDVIVPSKKKKVPTATLR